MTEETNTFSKRLKKSSPWLAAMALAGGWTWSSITGTITQSAENKTAITVIEKVFDEKFKNIEDKIDRHEISNDKQAEEIKQAIQELKLEIRAKIVRMGE